jgi:hypothetical protein
VPVSQHTMQYAIDRARIPLNDADKDRYSDADLLMYANEALQILRLQRADLFLGSLGTPLVSRVLADPVPLADSYVVAISDYVTARAETRDSEEELMSRATVFFSLFTASAMGG